MVEKKLPSGAPPYPPDEEALSRDESAESSSPDPASEPDFPAPPLSAPRPELDWLSPKSPRQQVIISRPPPDDETPPILSSIPPARHESSSPPGSDPLPLSRPLPRLDLSPPPSTRSNPLLAPAPSLAYLKSFSDSESPGSSRRPGPLSVAPKAARERLVRPSIAPGPVSLRPSMTPRLPGVAVGASEATRGSVGMMAGIAGAARRLERPEFFRQMNAIGLQSLGFICLVLGFVGAILVYQAGLQALRIVPDTSNVGASYLELLVRDLAASITGLMLATRVGAGIAAEIGSMKVTDQLDALRLCRTDPIDFLVAPRVAACLIVTPMLTIFGGAVAVFTGAGVGYFAFGINPNVFLDGRYVDVGDLITGIAKSIAFGVSIPLVAAHAGLYTSGGSEGVGNATTKAVVGSSLAVIILGFVIGALGQVLFG